ncbi:uncharacterized protein [Prorops nasuta]|uniref:uncharacterized protein n=1 Tax=Prorops nasuta TaxID=863751 RepID=UPI0034CD0B3F
MTNSSGVQSWSSMLRRIIVLLVFGLSLTSCEPVARQLLRSNVSCTSKNGTLACETFDLSSSNAPRNTTRVLDTANARASNNTRHSRYLLKDLTNGRRDDPAEVEARKKKGKGYGRIWLLAGAMKASMLYLMIHAVAAVAGKALLVAKIALAIATAVAIKKSQDHHEKTAYEIVKHPHHSYVQSHSTSVDYDSGHGGWEGHHRRKRRSIKRKL